MREPLFQSLPRPRPAALDEGGLLVDGHDLPNHLLAGVEPALLVAAERVLDGIDQAPVAVGAGLVRCVLARRELVDQERAKSEG